MTYKYCYKHRSSDFNCFFCNDYKPANFGNPKQTKRDNISICVHMHRVLKPSSKAHIERMENLAVIELK